MRARRGDEVRASELLRTISSERRGAARSRTSGEWLGEMGVIEGLSRSATARAAADGEVEVLTARLSIRLRRIEDKIAGDLLPFAHDRSPDGTDETASVAVIAEDATILLAAENEALRARIGAAAIHVAKLPFLAGRIPRVNPSLRDAPIS